MSEKQNKTEQKTEETKTQEKYVTKYDRKIQQREEQKKKEKREKGISTFVSVVVVLALVCLVAYFPIRSYMEVNETVVKIGGEDVSKVEFDYNYNLTKNNYLAQYGSFLSYYGLDVNSDFSTQIYDQNTGLTWEDFFQQMAVESIVTDKALKAQAEAEGFTYDVSKEYTAFEQSLKQAAEKAQVSTRVYLQQTYGHYATLGRIKGFLQDAIYANAYYRHVSELKAATDEEVMAYYQENTADYDSVDYYLTTIDAQLPTEPTELADPVEETETDAESTEETTYQPSEAEIEKAMADARELADAAVETVTADGELQENVLQASAPYAIREWLFDDSRKEGDTTVIEDSSSYRVYVLSFVKRYIDETPSADVRIVAVGENDAQAIITEWQNGGANEDSFAALADKYNVGTSFATEGGLYEGVTPDGTQDALSSWIFDASRKTGDVESIETENGKYVVYYVGTNKAKYQLDIADTLLSRTMEAYLTEIESTVSVEDEKGNLKYLQVSDAAEEDEADAVEADLEAETVTDTETVTEVEQELEADTDADTEE